ncbi:hypothetical protein [Clostridium ganghwense]|uniref:DUF4829 domain-containing protein n=1 Tax=Clostridium ganghwense TaxID=312089 RepID=A0ABT4CT03_9CLOT|nr:hypothetical protein [Clostridium ganghwense]MCY6372210.1 hypothetical protein [Clostridium ganghwense]
MKKITGVSRILVLLGYFTIMFLILYHNRVRHIKQTAAEQIEFNINEASNILKETWKPLKNLNNDLTKNNTNNYIVSKEEFIKILENRRNKEIAVNIASNLLEKSEDGKFNIKHNIFIPTIYDDEVSIKKAYIKKYTYLDKEELVIEESGKYERWGQFDRKNIYEKSDKGMWALKSISGVMNYGW